MPDEFPIIAISDPGGEKSEPMGTKAKFWVMYNHRRWLFKYNRPAHGEDWSEKIAAEIATQLHIACGIVELAQYEGKPGIISQNFVDAAAAGGRLVHGNELLSDFYGGAYPINKSYRVSQHCVPAVREILDKYSVTGTPSEVAPGAIKTLWHQFVGYLILDALIGNTDRHHENWGIITPPISTESPASMTVLVTKRLRKLELAPSFDHASSLGRELSDADRRDMLSGNSNRNISLYAKRCRSKMYLYSDACEPLTPVEAFMEATTDMPDVRSFWLGCLDKVGAETFISIIDRIPANRMSADARRFASAILVYNRERLLKLD